MELISCGKNIQLHSFPSLRTLSTYGCVGGPGCYDFQFFRKSKFFVATNPQLPAVEYLSLKSQGTISSVRKMKMENLSCIACPKAGLDVIALGLSTGHSRIINYKTREVIHRFPPEAVYNNSVVSMDFNATDDYLASAYDTGQVKIHGMKSFIEVDSFNIDKNSTLVRFHPTKRFQLVVASYLGSVSIYDAQAKKKSFHMNRPHSSPCRDVAVSTINESCLFSVGFDCFINIYDTRSKAVAQQLKTDYPLSAVALSPTSLECVVGNLKGEIILFDVRKLPESLAKVQSHENLVSRLTFVPPEKTEVDMTTSRSTECHEDVSTSDQGVSLNESVDVFSLLPIIDKNRPSEAAPLGRRDSFADFLSTHMNSLENTRKSMEVQEKRKSHSRRSTNHEEGMGDSEEKENPPDFSFVTFRKKRFSGQAEPKLSDVKEAEESEEVPGLGVPERDLEAPEASQTTEGEEASPKGEQEVPQGAENLPEEAQNPSNAEKEVQERQQNHPNGALEVPEREPSRSPTSFCNLHPNSNSTPNRIPDNPASSALKESIVQEITQAIKRSENELKYEVNSLNWKTYSEMFNLWQHHNRLLEEMNENIHVLADGMALLLRTDEVVSEFQRLQQENQALRDQLARINHRFSN
ncbi:protein NEDD1 [Lutzomyia longipalpis]|uniref:protein NEDD1 n=1 Tax=Lutzomyia longipalpis TaxID=7200 RepID=UPI0024832F19|nr:protein NEDD1 [Lutzomyia longipalpis]